MRPLPLSPVDSMCGSRCATAAFMTSADCSTKRQLHLTRPEQLADGLHPIQQRLVDDLQRRHLRHRLVEVGLQAGALTVDDAPLQPLEEWQRGQLRPPGSPRRRRRHAFEQLHQLLQRVVTLASTVVDEVESDLALLVGNPRHRQDLRCA